MIEIRKATIEDVEIIQDFYKKLCTKENHDFDSTINPHFGTTEVGRGYFKHSIESSHVLVLLAEDERKPVGYLLGRLDHISDYRVIHNMCEIDHMWVDEAYRSQEVGKQLMDMVTAWAKENGIKRMRVIASYQNEKGIRFYKREGFSEYNLILEKDI